MQFLRQGFDEQEQRQLLLQCRKLAPLGEVED